MSRLSFRRSHNGPPGNYAVHAPNSIEEALPLRSLVTISQIQRGTAGPDGCWRIFPGRKRIDETTCAVFVFEKRCLDKSTKCRRKDMVLQILRFESEQLDKLRHQRILHLVYPIEENSDYLNYVTEPVLGSLANFYRLHPSPLAFPEMEVILGIYQITDALRYLHSTQEVMHCNICMHSIVVNGNGQWKLTGFNFVERIVDTTKTAPAFIGFNPKQPCLVQPDLDFVAPEAQLHQSMSPLADMFSFGMVICALYNEGRSLIESDHSLNNYSRRLADLPTQFKLISERLPRTLVEPVRKMISEDVRERPTSQLFALLKIFNEPALLSYEGLLTLDGRSMNQKKEFFNRFAKVIAEIPVVLPLLKKWYHSSHELTPFVLPSILTLIHVAEPDHYHAQLEELLKELLVQQKTLQTSIVFLDLIEFYIDRLKIQDVKLHVISEMRSCMESGATKALETFQSAAAILPEYLPPQELHECLTGSILAAFGAKNANPKVRVICLRCIDVFLDHYEMSTVLDEILPFIGSIHSTEPGVICAILDIHRHLLQDKKFNLPYTVIAKKLLPPLIPMLIEKSLKLLDFRSLMDVCRLFLDQIERTRLRELSIMDNDSQSESCSSINSPLSNNRVLPLISMQKPTIDMDLGSSRYYKLDSSRPRSNSSEYNRRASGEDVNPNRSWSRNSLLMQRLRTSSHCSESLLYNTLIKSRESSLSRGRQWNKTSSNPSFAYRPNSNTSPNNPRSPLSGSLLNIRRHSGNLPTTSNPPVLNLPSRLSQHLDPRRHSYGSSAPSSVNSLITGNVCEGPFITPPGSRRTSAQSAFGGVVSPMTEETPPVARRATATELRRSSLNALNDFMANVFGRRQS